MTATMRHIQDLSVDEWAALTRRAAVEAVAAAERRGKTPPAELVAVAAMTERQLVERRARNVPARQRLSPLMQLVEADHSRRMAEGRTRDAHQDKLDAEAVAAAARAEAEESSRAAAAARAHLRTVQQQAAERDTERTAERAAAAEAHERGMQQLRAELEQVRADAEAVIAAARERATAAEARAQQRATERTAATEDAIRQAQAQAARTSSIQPLSIPVPPFEFRSETAHIESALNALQQIDYVLEVGMADEGDSGIPLDIDMTQTLVWAVQEHARYLANESPSATSSAGQPPGDAAAAYAEAAAQSFRALLQRIETVTRRLAGRDLGPYAEIVNLVVAMLADPWVQRARRLDSPAP